ncbi:MAG: PolC-type DNA polymerase III [Tissierellia bacterium]|nr:PolC-type DNA polymerase III [Tissierellia bacterium]
MDNIKYKKLTEILELKILNTDELNSIENIYILSIKIFKSKRIILLELNSNELESDLENKIKNNLEKRLIPFKIEFIYNNLNKFESPYERIKSIICKNNPSSACWFTDDTVNIDEEHSIIDIYIPNNLNGDFAPKKERIISDLEKEFSNWDLNFKDSKNSLFEEDSFFEGINAEEIDFANSIKYSSSEKKSNSSFKTFTYGKKSSFKLVKMEDLNEDPLNVAISGKLFKLDHLVTKKELYIISLFVTDRTEAVKCKLFLNKSIGENFLKSVNVGDHLLIEGSYLYDNYERDEVFKISYMENIEIDNRTDNSDKKRIELSIHTKMSAMDGTANVSEFIERAKSFGHEAIAITDNAVAQAFPEAMESGEANNLKIIYGLEANVVEDDRSIMTNYIPDKIYDDFVVFDIETTGLYAAYSKIIEIGAVRIKDGIIVDEFHELIDPKENLSPKIVQLTNITDGMLYGKPLINEVIERFYNFFKDSVLVAHNASFDINFIRLALKNIGIEINNPIIDTLEFSRAIYPDAKSHRLGTLSKRLGVSLINAHRALDDAKATAEVFLKMCSNNIGNTKFTATEINFFSKDIEFQRTFPNPVLLLVKNLTGLKNLYKLISKSHMDYFHMQAKIPKSLLLEYKEGILIGSGNIENDFNQAVLNSYDDTKIKDIINFYDFISVQSPENYKYIIGDNFKDKTEVEKYLSKTIEIANKYQKTVIATSDVYYLDKEDAILREIINYDSAMFRRKSNFDNSRYFKTTDEMLEEFSFLGEDRAREIVIENTHKINDQIEKIRPIPEGTFPPVVKNSDEDLKKLVYSNAHRIYGEKLPEIVSNRIERELDLIISKGYSVLYMISNKLVKKSNEDGFYVGSRGSVGSSFVATMSDITEVNPLGPHYICPNCQYSEFIDINTSKYLSGPDLPDKDCPNCQTTLQKDGHNIPFEVFLGFHGEKEPDIDLNFAGEYQSSAHEYIEELFGKGYVFRAGTISTVAEKMAYASVSKYHEENEIYIRDAYKEYLKKRIAGVKKTTGQHPGGIMICPKYKDIYDFTPIQHPADKKSDIITTHFNYEAISETILKLDILGHDGPSMIKQLEEFTGIDSLKIDLNDKDTMSLFSSADSLKLNKEIFDCDLGTLGIPEFGTYFVRDMLKDTSPDTFDELTRISGLSHGTNVWINNAKDLINNGQADLKTVICTRDDIMLTLIKEGCNEEHAFNIMEQVRKGKGLKDYDIEAIKNTSVPDWYIDSCQKIKYMFPKSHAVAYVMLSFRIAYFKLNYPLEFYSTVFTAKLNDFDGEILFKSPDIIKAKIKEIKSQPKELNVKEKSQIYLMEIVLEMYARGYEFENLDLYKSQASKFFVKDGKIIPPFRSLMGMGENVANSIVNERENGKFISIEDFKNRARIGDSTIDLLKRNKCLEGLEESNQISFF